MTSDYEAKSVPFNSRGVLPIVYAVLAILIPLLFAAAPGLIGLPAPEYNMARAAFILCLLSMTILILLWVIFSEEDVKLKVFIGILVLVIAAVVQPMCLSWVSYEEGIASRKTIEEAAAKSAARNLSELSDSEIRARVLELTKKLRQFQFDHDQRTYEMFSKNITSGDSKENWREHAAKIMLKSTRENNDFRRLYLPEMLALRDAMKARLTETMPIMPFEAAPAFQGMLAGVRPASAAADYLESIAAKMP